MSRRSIVLAVTAAIMLFSILVAGAYLTTYANTTDNAHWNGAPLPPCFENAKMCGGHLLGTDESGRDLLARLILGTRATLGVSFLAVLFAVGVGAALALLARTAVPVKYVITRVARAISCITPWPFMTIIMLLIMNVRDLVEHRAVSPAVLALCMAVLSWPCVSLLMMRPWSARAVLSQAARDWAKIILTLATLDFFGFGMQPPWPSWGNMLSNMQSTIQGAWWIAVLPAVCILVAVLSLEVFARRISSIQDSAMSL